MKNLLLLTILIVLFSCSGGAKKNQATDVSADNIEVSDDIQIFDDGHYAENSLDYWGVYQGILPAADCPGIETTLTINEDHTFSLKLVYIDRDSSFNNRGTYTLEKSYLTLTFTNGEETEYYFIGENTATRLTADKEFIEGELANQYVLTKVE